MLGERPQRQRGKESESADDQDHPDQEADKESAVRWKCPGRCGNGGLCRQRSGDRQHRHDHRETADQHRERQRKVVEQRVAAEPAERAAVVCCARSERVKDLAEAVRPCVLHRGEPDGQYGGERGEAENGGRQAEDGEHRHLDFPRLDLLAEIFGCAADHQTSHEYGDDREQQHAVEAGADAADDDLAQLHVDQRDHAAQRHEAVVHGVDGAARGRRRDYREQRGEGNAEPHLLTLHVARRWIDAERRERRVRLRFRPVADGDADNEQDAHGAEDGPALPFIPDHAPEDVGQRRADDEDQQHLHQIAERRRVLVRVRRVGVEKAAAVCSQHLDSELRSGRPLRDRLLRPLERRRLDVGAKVLRNPLPD
jgi:hypothetical protein